MRQQLIEIYLAQDGAQRRLRELLRLPVIVLYSDHGLRGVQYLPVNDGIHLQRAVVASDDVLGRHFQGLLAKIDPDHFVNRSKHQNDPRSLGLLEEMAEAEDHRAFVLPQNLDGVEKVEKDNDYGDDDDEWYSGHGASRQPERLSHGFYGTERPAQSEKLRVHGIQRRRLGRRVNLQDQIVDAAHHHGLSRFDRGRRGRIPQRPAQQNLTSRSQARTHHANLSHQNLLPVHEVLPPTLNRNRHKESRNQPNRDTNGQRRPQPDSRLTDGAVDQ